MPEPIEYRVVQSLQTAIRAIAVASGFFYTVAALAVKLDSESSVESLIGQEKLRPFFILEVNPDRFTLKPSDRVDVDMPFTVHAVADSDVTVDEDWIRTYFRICADVEKAIVSDHRRGGLATDTRITTREFVTYEGRQVWAKVNGTIRVPRLYGAPNG